MDGMSFLVKNLVKSQTVLRAKVHSLPYIGQLGLALRFAYLLVPRMATAMGKMFAKLGSAFTALIPLLCVSWAF